MYKVLHYPYSKQLLKELTEGTVMHKLTYKTNLCKKTDKGEDTLYAYLLDSVERNCSIL